MAASSWRIAVIGEHPTLATMDSQPDTAIALRGGAIAVRDRLRAGELTCVEVAEAFLAAVGDDELRAWAALDPEILLARARELDRLDAAKRATLPLFGVP